MDIDELFDVFDQSNSQSNSNSADIITEDSIKNGKFSDSEELLKNIYDERSKRKSLENEKESEEISIAKKQKLAFEDISVDECLTRIKVHKVEAAEGCLHEVAVPHDSEYAPLEPIAPESIPAKIYPFILDPFQKEAILCLENTQSVLVSAHTSAGKTVIAEYAIAMSLSSKQRVVYTTPIKALSNQKYREFYEEFKDVGLMTGDVTINPSASCLIMTTEILRSMLYRGSEVMKEVGWVIFDEIHYMRDKERGVVWEETIILLPDNVHYVFLSATIPNAIQFAEWICYLHKQPCHVVYTEYRPVPLQHYIFPTAGQGLHLVVDENGSFQEDNFNKAMAVLQNPDFEGGGQRKGRNMKNKQASKDCYNLVQMIMEMNFAPVIVFSFRRKECEAYGISISKLDFNTEREKQAVEEIFNNALDVLSEEDRKLPQVEHVLPLLKRGIGIHHSGLLPILKETVEILFSEGLIKALFATETFAMGLNMPARTVMFTTARKFDGQDMRYLSSSEYIQMSGRAGRRGLDERGIVILMVDEKMESKAAKEIIKGHTDPLNSAFHLSYNMVLNLLRVDGINPEYMMQRSFYQFQNHAAIPQLQARLKELMAEYDSIELENEAEVASYYLIRQNLESLAKEFHQYIVKPQYCVPFLQPGRMVKVKRGDIDYGWGIIINYQKKFVPLKNNSIDKRNEDGSPCTEAIYIVDVMLHLSKQSIKSGSVADYRPAQPGQIGEMHVFPVKLNLISQFSAVKLYYPQDLRPYDNRMTVLKSIQAIEKKFPRGVPLLDPIEDLKITEKPFLDLVKKIKSFEDRMKQHNLHDHPNLESLLQLYTQKAKLGNETKELASDLRQKRTLLQMDDLTCRKRVLRRLGYCTQADVVELKGRVACEISCANEILLTEMIFHNLFNDLTPAQIAALISCFVCQERLNEFPKLSEELCGPLRKMQELARMIARVSVESRLEMDEQNFVETFKPFLMDVVYSWCNGASFSSICKLTDAFEGTIIRAMRRQEELLRQMSQAAKTIGNKDLEAKFTESIKILKRGIVFAASLYL